MPHLTFIIPHSKVQILFYWLAETLAKLQFKKKKKRWDRIHLPINSSGLCLLLLFLAKPPGTQGGVEGPAPPQNPGDFPLAIRMTPASVHPTNPKCPICTSKQNTSRTHIWPSPMGASARAWLRQWDTGTLHQRQFGCDCPILRGFSHVHGSWAMPPGLRA